MLERDLLKYVQADDLPQGCRDLVEVMGIETVIDLINYSGGGCMYFPSKGSVTKNARNRLIRKNFNGGNYKELGKMFGISDVQVRTIVN
jgi:Mor family transcriptional regulator